MATTPDMSGVVAMHSYSLFASFSALVIQFRKGAMHNRAWCVRCEDKRKYAS
jgi:hypothetical protein